VIFVNLYRKEERNGRIHIRSDEEPVCPVCLGELRVIGSRDRKVIERGDRQQTYVIRRLRCKSCETIHHELPDLLVPYKRHCAATIEQVIAEPGQPDTVDATSSNTTRRIRKWWSAAGVYFAFIVATLNAKLGVALNVGSRPLNVIRAVVNSNNWVHTRSGLCPLSG
jgi:hypothetical protein